MPAYSRFLKSALGYGDTTAFESCVTAGPYASTNNNTAGKTKNPMKALGVN